MSNIRDPVVAGVMEEFIFSLSDSCPPLAKIVEGYVYDTVRRYHWNGELHIKYQTKYGVMDGPYRSWHENGTPMCDMTYRNGEPHGSQLIWSSSGHIYSRRIYENGERHGVTLEWHNDRQLRSYEEYVRGKRHGEYTEWHRNGVKKTERTYENGEIVGREWDEDGELRYETYYGEESTMWARMVEAEEDPNHTLEWKQRAKRCQFMLTKLSYDY